MRVRVRSIVALMVLLVVGGGALVTEALASDPGGGTLTNGIAFYGPGSGAEFPSAGTDVVPGGSRKSVTTVLLPAYALGTGGGQDENHVVATLQSHLPGYWIVAARIKRFISDNGDESGKLVVWLNKPAPENTSISFSYMTFSIFND